MLAPFTQKDIDGRSVGERVKDHCWFGSPKKLFIGREAVPMHFMLQRGNPSGYLSLTTCECTACESLRRQHNISRVAQSGRRFTKDMQPWSGEGKKRKVTR